MEKNEKRYIGLDVHKHYLIALGVDENLKVVLPARRVELAHLEAWMKKTLTRQDEVVLEMTTNTWQLYDELSAYAGSVTVAHPPLVALITRAQVMNDKIAASILARLLAKGLLVGIWVPPQEVRELLQLKPGQKMQILAYDNQLIFIPVRSIKQARGSLKGIITDTPRNEDDRAC